MTKTKLAMKPRHTDEAYNNSQSFFSPEVWSDYDPDNTYFTDEVLAKQPPDFKHKRPTDPINTYNWCFRHGTSLGRSYCLSYMVKVQEGIY